MSDCHFIGHSHITTKLFTFIELILLLMLNNSCFKQRNCQKYGAINASF